MIITISGRPGAGKTTVGKLLAKKLNYRFISMGDLRGGIAKEHNMTINELNAVGEKESWTDKEVDDKTKALAKEDNLVLDSYLAFHFLPHSFKVFLDVQPEEGAERIVHDERDNEKIGKNKKEHMPIMLRKIESDTIRYKKWYNLDISDKKHYDLWLDTTGLTSEETMQKIFETSKAE